MFCTNQPKQYDFQKLLQLINEGVPAYSDQEVRAFMKQEARRKRLERQERQRLMKSLQPVDRGNSVSSASADDHGGEVSTATECSVDGGNSTDTAAGGGDEEGGDPDPEPERRRRHKHPQQHPQHPNPADQSARQSAAPPSALTNFPLLPDEAFVRLPVVTGLYACSPATVWRHVKAGLIPAPVKLSERIAAWRVGDLRAALVSLSS